MKGYSMSFWYRYKPNHITKYKKLKTRVFKKCRDGIQIIYFTNEGQKLFRDDNIVRTIREVITTDYDFKFFKRYYNKNRKARIKRYAYTKAGIAKADILNYINTRKEV